MGEEEFSKLTDEAEEMASQNDDGIELNPDPTKNKNANETPKSTTKKKWSFKKKEAKPAMHFKGLVKGVMIGQYIEKTFKMKQKTDDLVEEVPTNCYGEIYFKETTKQTTGKFLRLSDETDVKTLMNFMTGDDQNSSWGLEKPRLLISVTGGAKSFVIDPRLKKDFLDGLTKVASTPGAWVVSGGTNTGVMKMVGDANHGNNNTCIGIATWGIIADKESLTGVPRRYDYHLGSYLVKDKSAFLDYNHSHFLLVDDGTEGKYGGEIPFRGKFEDHLWNLKVPTVLLVLQGGPGTLNTVYNTSVKNLIPCVLIKGSGGVADLLVYALTFEEEINGMKEGKKHEGLLKEISKVTNKNEDVFYERVLDCLKASAIFTLAEFETGMDTDDAILTALLLDKNKSPSHYEQIRLSIIWNRVDLAESRVLARLQKWEPEEGNTAEFEFNKLMIMALAMNRKDFVKLLLDYGISVKKAVTKTVLEFLYYCYGGSLRKADISPEYMSLEEAGKYKDLFEDLLSYEAVGDGRTNREGGLRMYPLKRVQERLIEMLQRIPEAQLTELMDTDPPTGTFDDPFRQLFIWAVTNNLLDMALFFWEFQDDGIATALIASEITNNLLNDVRFKETTNLGEGTLEDTLNTFSQLAIDLMNSCYKTHEEETEIIVTNRLKLFNGKSSCLELAIATEQEDFVAQPAIQGLLDEVWYGSIKATEISQWVVFATIFFPFLLLNMDIRSKEEMDRMNVNDGQQKHTLTRQKSRHGPKKRRMKYRQLSRVETRLPFWRKVMNFHLYSPVVRFFEHTIGYIGFLMLLSYVAMVKKTSTDPSWSEILLAVTVFGFLVQESYQVLHVDTSADLKSRLVGYLWDIWNLFDILCITVFIIALILRSFPQTLPISHFFYGVDASLWIVRLLQVLYVDTLTGPYVVMIGQMIGDMFKFLVILLIFLLSYGIGVKAFLDPSPDSPQMFVQTIFHPYFHIHGEYFLDGPSNDTTMLGTPMTNKWQEPLALFYMAVYLLITNILLLNLLIAIFNNTYERVMNNSERIWKYRRYALVVEYAERRTFLWSPFSLIHHCVVFCWYVLSKCCPSCIGNGPTRNSGLTQKKELSEDRQLELRAFERTCCIQTMRKREEDEANVASGEGSWAQGGTMLKDELKNNFAKMEQKLSGLLEELRKEKET